MSTCDDEDNERKYRPTRSFWTVWCLEREFALVLGSSSKGTLSVSSSSVPTVLAVMSFDLVIMIAGTVDLNVSVLGFFGSLGGLAGARMGACLRTGLGMGL